MKWKHYVLLVAATFVWGSGHPLGKLILEEVTPLQFAMVSSFLTAFSIFLVLLVTRRLKSLFQVQGGPLVLSLLSGSTIFFVYPILSFSALQRIPASANSVLTASNTLFVAMLSPWFLKEKLRKMGIISLIISFIGIPFIVFSTGGGSGFTGIGTISVFGSSLSLTGAVVAAFYTIIGRKVSAAGFALYVTLIGSFFGGLLLLPIVGLTSGFSHLFNASPKVLILIAYWGIFSGLGYGVYYHVLERMEAARASSFMYLSPFFAIVLSVILLKENLTFLLLFGTALVFLGIFGTQKSRIDSSPT